jgi:hypothetical protein
MVVATIVLMLIVALVTKMVIDVQKVKVKRILTQNSISWQMDWIANQLKEKAVNTKYEGDISDLGNEIGYVVGLCIDDMNDAQIKDFIHGLRHGISLTNGTH